MSFLNSVLFEGIAREGYSCGDDEFSFILDQDGLSVHVFAVGKAGKEVQSAYKEGASIRIVGKLMTAYDVLCINAEHVNILSK